MAFGLGINGLSLPRQADFIASVKKRYTDLTKESPDWERDEVLGSFLAVVTLELDELSQIVQSIYDAFDENNATGLQLENLAGLFPGISKEIATSSVVILTVEGTPGTVVPSGFLVEGGGTEGVSRWALTDGFTVPASGTLEGILADAVLAGPTAAQVGEVSKIVNPISGWASVTNPAVAVLGTLKETDDELRKRRRESLQIVGGRSLGAILGNVLALPFITDAIVIENADSVAQVIKGAPMAPNSIGVVVQPNPLTTAQQTALAKVLYNVVPVGIQILGGETATVTGADGLEKEVAWNHPAQRLATVQWVIRMEPGFAFSRAKPIIETATADYFSALGVGEPARKLALTSFVVARVEGIQQAFVLLDGALPDIDPDAVQVLVFSVPGSSVTEL